MHIDLRNMLVALDAGYARTKVGYCEDKGCVFNIVMLIILSCS